MSNGARREPGPFFLFDEMSGAGNITPLASGTGALQRSEGAARAGWRARRQRHCSAV